MNVNAVSNAQSEVYGAYTKSAEKKESKQVTTENKEADAVYEKTEKQSKPATYSINKMSAKERAALVQQLKEDQASREKNFINLVQDMMRGQAKSNAMATGNDSIWKFLASGDFTVDPATKAQAQADIAEDGYWGVKQTSQRLFDFASALAGDDVEKMKKMQAAMEKGFRQATAAWGKSLPDISQKTMDAANKLFDDYYASKAS